MKNFLGSCLLISLAVLFAPIVGRGATSTPYPGTGYIQIVGNTTAGDMVTVQVDANGVLATSGGGGGGGGTSSTFGAAFPATGTALGISDGTNMVALLKGQTTMVGSIPVAIASNQSALPVTGTFWQATQPVSGTFWQVTQPVSGTFWQATQPISASALPLPTGASTAAKQPALGTAGAASTDVITVQGIASGVAQPVSGTFWQATQPISGTITSTQGTAASITGGGWPFINGEIADTTGTFTNGTQTGTVTNLVTDGYDTAVVTVNGTFGTATAVFEVTDDGGTTWYPTQATRTDTPIVENGYTSLTNTNRMWVVNIKGCGGFQVRSTAVASGTVSIRITIASAPLAATTASQNTIFPLTGAAAQTATVNNILPNPSGSAGMDVGQFQSGTVQVNSTGTGGSYIFEGSNDDTTYVTIPVYNKTVITGTPITAAITPTSSTIIYGFPIDFQYLRVRIATTITGGSIATRAIFKQAAWSPSVYQVGQATAGNLNTTATIASGTVTTVTTLTGTTTLTPGTGAANLGKAEDAVSANGDTLVGIAGVRRDVLASNTSAAGDYSEVAVTKYAAHYAFDQEKNLPTYRASTIAGGIASAVSATDIAILPGNATNTVYVTKVIVTATQTTAGEIGIYLIKRSAANTSGTSASMTVVPMDSADTGVSVPLSYTANPTPGATVGICDQANIPASPAATGVTNCTYTFNFGERGKGVKLSGIAQGLAVNLNGATVTGGTFGITYEYREEP